VKLAFGAPCEYQSICHVRHRNGVHSIITTCPTPEVFGPPFRVTGTDGVIEVGWGPRPGPMLRMWRRGTPDWEALDCKNENLHGPGYIERAIADVLDCLKTGREPELCARHAMNATEIIFGCWESSRRRARVDMPLDICDSPLVSMLESGEMKTRT
jgi:predicted dehydrogenase